MEQTAEGVATAEPPQENQVPDPVPPKKRPRPKRLGNGVAIPPPASAAQMKQTVERLVAENVAVIAGQSEAKMGKYNSQAKNELMTSTTRAALMALLGPDIEAAKEHFREKLLITAEKLRAAIERDIDEMPMASRAFAFACMVDKEQALANKMATTSAGAQVGQQINVFLNNEVSRAEMMATLMGKFPEQEPKQVETVVSP